MHGSLPLQTKNSIDLERNKPVDFLTSYHKIFWEDCEFISVNSKLFLKNQIEIVIILFAGSEIGFMFENFKERFGCSKLGSHCARPTTRG